MMATVSSHTLNGLDGTHAGGIGVTLVNLTSGTTLFATETDSGGRLSEKIDLADAGPTDRYQLTFATGPFWHSSGHARAIDEIVLRFTMPDPSARYHMPVILSPHSYSIWHSHPE
jgi:5-hydroxyisourate hydrolase